MVKFEAAAMLDDDSNWNESDEEAEQAEKCEASDDYDGGEDEYESLEGHLDYIKGIYHFCAYL